MLSKFKQLYAQKFKPRPRIVLDLGNPLISKICQEISSGRLECNTALNYHDKDVSEAVNLRYGFIGALGEYTIWKLFGIMWHGALLPTKVYLKWRKKCLDFGWIEVKTTQGLNARLSIGDKDLDKGPGIIIWVYIEHINYIPKRAYITAWTTVSDCLKHRIEHKNNNTGKKYYTMPHSEVKDVGKLVKLLNILNSWRACGKTLLNAIEIDGDVFHTFELESKAPPKWKTVIK